jgi:hypothetical protein
MNSEQVNTPKVQVTVKRFGPVVLWTLFGLLVLMILAAIVTPNLLRSRIAANQAAQFARAGGPEMIAEQEAAYASGGALATKDARSAVGGAKPIQDLRKIAKTATMDLEVAEVAKAVSQAVEVARKFGGYVEQSRVSGSTGATLTLRVPAENFDDARASLAGSAKRVNSEQVNAADVTAQYVDIESQLRNAHAEEAQYLEIMRRSGTIKDTVMVAERLAEVRGRIERMQGQINLLSHQVEMATISLSIRTVATPVERALQWHPVKQARESFLDGAQALADYANTMIALALYLPVVLAWCGTIVFGFVIGWKVVRWTWKRWFVTAPAQA